MSRIDPIIEAAFGPVPEGLDLSGSNTVEYDLVSCVVLGLATAAVALRFYVRAAHNAQQRNLGIDDHTILLSLFCTGALVATTVIAGKNGSGTHVWSMNHYRLTTLLKIVYAEPYVYGAAVSSTKISILLLYRRLFFVPSNTIIKTDLVFPIMFWIATFFTCTYPIILWTVMACACRPINFYWEQYTGAKDGFCIDVLQFYLIFGIINMVNDVIILAVPIPRILKLQMNTKKKASIVGVMLLGSFVCIASIVRIYYLHKLTTDIDMSYILGPGFGWSSLEPSVAIISACLPTFAPLFVGLRNKGSSNNTGDKINSSTGYLRNDPRSNHIRLDNFDKPDLGCMHGESQFYIEDGDEVHLTDNNNFRETLSQDSDNSEQGNNIMVKTQVQIVTTDSTIR